MKLSANLAVLWQELPFFDRFEAAASAGFSAVEVPFPYEFAVQDMQQAMRQSGMRLVSISGPPPNYTGGAQGYAATPGGEERFKHDMRRVYRYADVLGAACINVSAGKGSGQDSFDTLVQNLKWASRAAPKKITLIIEPVNEQDNPGSFLSCYNEAARVLDAVRKPNVRLQFDSYQAQTIHGDALDIWNRFGLRAAHVQLGDTPGRIALGEGEINFSALIAAIKSSEYKGWVSADYLPGDRVTEDSLSWMKRLLQPAE